MILVISRVKRLWKILHESEVWVVQNGRGNSHTSESNLASQEISYLYGASDIGFVIMLLCATIRNWSLCRRSRELTRKIQLIGLDPTDFDISLPCKCLICRAITYRLYTFMSYKSHVDTLSSLVRESTYESKII